ncbi:MAG TPA: FtsW/RodA/SpoVE family cell cycle protein, partial [Sulfurovum sp.]|nr:FtsW/RodA/SpoVE family cell cycle protein [Sulfurovum sp.]
MMDKPLLAAVMMLLTLSLVMSYSLSAYTVVHFEYADFHFFLRQAIAVFIGFIIMVILSKMDPDRSFSRVGLTLFILFFILMIGMQFLPSSLVTAVGGAKRWIRMGPMSIAPVEFFKVGFVFFLAWSFSRKLLHRSKMAFWEEVGA